MAERTGRRAPRRLDEQTVSGILSTLDEALKGAMPFSPAPAAPPAAARVAAQGQGHSVETAAPPAAAAPQLPPPPAYSGLVSRLPAPAADGPRPGPEDSDDPPLHLRGSIASDGEAEMAPADFFHEVGRASFAASNGVAADLADALLDASQDLHPDDDNDGSASPPLAGVADATDDARDNGGDGNISPSSEQFGDLTGSIDSLDCFSDTDDEELSVSASGRRPTFAEGHILEHKTSLHDMVSKLRRQSSADLQSEAFNRARMAAILQVGPETSDLLKQALGLIASPLPDLCTSKHDPAADELLPQRTECIAWLVKLECTPYENSAGLELSKRGLADGRVFIQGIEPNSPASRQPLLTPDCELLSVDGVPVRKFLSLPIVKPNSSLRVVPTHDCVAQAIASVLPSPFPSTQAQDQAAKLPHGLAIIPLLAEDDKSEEAEDLVFQHSLCKDLDSDPARKKSPNLTSELSGAWITLVHSMSSSLTKDNLATATLALGGVETNLVFEVIGMSHVIALALPASKATLRDTLVHLQRLLHAVTALYGPAIKAFANDNLHHSLDTLCSLFFSELLAAETSTSSLRPNNLFSVPLLFPLSMSVHAAISDVLRELDVGRYESALDDSQACTSLGSCLFYRGALICSLLGMEHTRTIANVLHMLNLLSATSGGHFPSSTFWMPLHDARRFGDDRQLFLAVDTSDRAILCSLLMGWHGCEASRLVRLPGPDNQHLAQMHATTWHLRESGAFLSVSAAMNDAAVPRIESVDGIFSHATERSETHSYSVRSEEGSHRRKSILRRVRSQNPRSATQSSQNRAEAANEKMEDANMRFSLAAGLYNEIFHVVHFDTAAGVYIRPEKRFKTLSAEDAAVLENFETSCERIRKIFAERGLAPMPRAPNIVFSQETALDNAMEHGVLFHANPASLRVLAPRRKQKHKTLDTFGDTAPAANLAYWVVGRQVPTMASASPRELFVCFRDGTSQSVVEMAFRMQFAAAF
eukprot:m.93903 g.93903  ORF g.93903 m.93903 type:complete len:987 (+) comp8701_c0_seq4:55-3015(+)